MAKDFDKLAQNYKFDMRGSSSTYTYDLNSDAKPTVNPPDQGREGTRGDVSRGDEVNR